MGISRGIERLNKIMMPLFFIIFLILAVRVAMLPGVSEGYRFMFTPRWEALKDPMIWIWAMGQAFFSLSVTGSGMIVYGAYLSKDEDVVGVAQHTALFDTIAAVVAALVIIPACFSYGLDVGAGPSLLFVTLPTILQDIPMGRLFAIILYLAMIFAGVSSLQNMFEAVAESLLHKFPKLSRTAVLAILCVLCLGIGIFMEPISKWGPSARKSAVRCGTTWAASSTCRSRSSCAVWHCSCTWHSEFPLNKKGEQYENRQESEHYHTFSADIGLVRRGDHPEHDLSDGPGDAAGSYL